MLKVRDIISPVVIIVAAEDSAASAAECLAQAAISGAPVRDKDGKLVGMLSPGGLDQRVAGPLPPASHRVGGDDARSVYRLR